MTTINYIGCKENLLPFLKDVIKNNIPNINELSFADLFSGTGIISYNAQFYFKSVQSNDLEYYSFIINCALLKCNYSLYIQNIIDECNSLHGIEGLIFKNYSPNQHSNRFYFTNYNAKKCDAIREHISNLKRNGKINKYEYCFLLASLLTSIDRVANISNSYNSCLKDFKKTSLKEMFLSPIHTRTNIIKDNNSVSNKLTEELISNYKFDVVYLDPPHNNRNYSVNYSVLNFISFYKPDIQITGKYGFINNYNKSNFCSKTKCSQTFENLLTNINCKYLILSYNDDGIIPLKNIKEMLLKKGDVTLYKCYKYTIYKNEKKTSKIEYLWFCKVNFDLNKTNIYREQESEILC